MTNAVFSQTLAKLFKRPCFLSLPKKMVQILFGEMVDALLLTGQKVLPQSLTQAGYEFRFISFEKALKAIYLTESDAE